MVNKGISAWGEANKQRNYPGFCIAGLRAGIKPLLVIFKYYCILIIS